MLSVGVVHEYGSLDETIAISSILDERKFDREYKYLIGLMTICRDNNYSLKSLIDDFNNLFDVKKSKETFKQKSKKAVDNMKKYNISIKRPNS